MISPDNGAGVEMTVQHVRDGGFERIFLVIPFEGEPLLDDCIGRVRISLAPLGCEEILFQNKETISALTLEGEGRIRELKSPDHPDASTASLLPLQTLGNPP